MKLELRHRFYFARFHGEGEYTKFVNTTRDTELARLSLMETRGIVVMVKSSVFLGGPSLSLANHGDHPDDQADNQEYRPKGKHEGHENRKRWQQNNAKDQNDRCVDVRTNHGFLITVSALRYEPSLPSFGSFASF